MPLVTAAVLAYAAGLLSGFGGAFIWTLAAGALVVWRGARTGRERFALTALAVAGLGTAAAARIVESSCVERLEGAREWEVTVAAEATPGAFVPAQHACGLDLRISVERGQARAGSRVSVRGEAAIARGSLLVTHAVVRELRGPSALAKWRAAIGRKDMWYHIKESLLISSELNLEKLHI